ncbi:MAG: bifunctional DNA primase/polymerase, partial [Gemmataceae bacterium]|nr:bifunctional DNA primase/polymerase [Gemmataceae bacterium]
MTNATFSAAQNYLAHGISLVPIATDGQKRPAGHLLPRVPDENGIYRSTWKPFRDRRPTDGELSTWYGAGDPVPGIGLVLGQVSGGLEVIDCESKEIADEFEQRLTETNATLAAKLLVVESPRGRHYYYRCSGPAPKDRDILARGVPVGNNVPLLIEFRGEGHLIVAPGSPAACHPSGQRYRFRNEAGNTLHRIREAERDLILQCARDCNRYTPPAPPANTRWSQVPNADGAPQLDRPGDDFNARATWAQVLEPA